jgi:hypothetical protein
MMSTITRKITLTNIKANVSPSGIEVLCNVVCTDDPEWWKLDYHLDEDGECDELSSSLASSNHAAEYIQGQGSFGAALAAFLEERALEIDWEVMPHRKLALDSEQHASATQAFKMFVGAPDPEPGAIYIMPEAIAVAMLEEVSYAF